MSSLRFCLILKAAMDDFGVGPTKLEEILRDKGITNISNKRISEYLRSVSTPSFEKARVILEALEFPMEDAALLESLQVNRELIKEEKEEQALLLNSSYGRTLNVHIRLRNLVPGASSLDSERRVIERVNELYGTHDIVTYVEKLISLDLRESVLKGE